MVSAHSLDSPAHAVPELAVLTDADGRYEWPPLASGRYELRVATPTAKGAVRVVVQSGTTAHADLTLSSE
jgi:hypothetical protein